MCFIVCECNIACLPQFTDQYKSVNPVQQVPAVTIDGITLCQSVSSLIFNANNKNNKLSLLLFVVVQNQSSLILYIS